MQATVPGAHVDADCPAHDVSNRARAIESGRRIIPTTPLLSFILSLSVRLLPSANHIVKCVLGSILVYGAPNVAYNEVIVY